MPDTTAARTPFRSWSTKQGPRVTRQLRLFTAPSAGALCATCRCRSVGSGWREGREGREGGREGIAWPRRRDDGRASGSGPGTRRGEELEVVVVVVVEVVVEGAVVVGQQRAVQPPLRRSSSSETSGVVLGGLAPLLQLLL